jgi:polysaccharide biosynthesis protein PslH
MSRRSALVLTGRLPWPLDDGGLIGLWQLLWSVSRGYRTTLVTMVSPAEMERPLPPPPGPADFDIVRVPHVPPPLPVAALQGLVGRWPYTLARYRSARYAAELRRVVAERRPDAVVINHLHFATYADDMPGAALVLREHNLEYRWLDRYAGSLSNPVARAYARYQSVRMRSTEGRLCERMDLVLAIQEEEATLLRAIAPRARIEIVPIGVDFARYLPPARTEPPIVLLVGSYQWPPNEAGARRFLAEGWPLVRAGCPAARLRVVGKNMPPALAAAVQAAGGEAVGYVESMAPEFAQATALVVPLWVGAGARVKIVEASAARLPVVSTPLGAEGLGLESGRHFLEAETPAGLADALLRLLRDGASRESIAAEAHALGAASFSLEAVARGTNEAIEAAIERRAGARAR